MSDSKPERRAGRHVAVPILISAGVAILGVLGVVRMRRAWQDEGQTAAVRLRVDRTMFDLAALTGGDFYFWAPGEFASSTLEIPLGRENLLLSYGELLESEVRFEVPVDDAVGRIEFFLGAQRFDDFYIQRPDGGEVEPISRVDGYRVQVFEYMRLVTIETPDAGLWRIRLRGDGLYEVAVREANTERRGLHEPIGLIAFEVLEPGGRPGHEGMFTYDGELLPGEDRLIRFAVSGSFGSIVPELVSLQGNVLAYPSPVDQSPSEAPDEFLVRCIIPDESFRLAIRGFDHHGGKFRRMSSSAFLIASED